ncbi:MAG: MogA/MoaB family molybdenum cofactor biosynthesis protein [Actinomycetota bacterium]
MRVAVLTVSDRASAGTYEDLAGPEVERVARAAGAEITARALVPDERNEIARQLRDWADNGIADVILTTGGTGLAPRDVTPEATRDVIEREAPGIVELMRARGLEITPFAALARQVAGTRGRALIVNLPGSPKAAAESLEAVIAILPHAVELMTK